MAVLVGRIGAFDRLGLNSLAVLLGATCEELKDGIIVLATEVDVLDCC